jgi:aspartate racemase
VCVLWSDQLHAAGKSPFSSGDRTRIVDVLPLTMRAEFHRRRLGLIGGLDDAAPVTYWRAINQEVQFHLGPDATADLLLSAGATGVLRELYKVGDWPRISHLLSGEALRLSAAGAEALLVCDASLAPVARELGRTSGIPVLCIAQAVAATLRTCRLRSAAILGVRSPAEEQLWRDSLPGITLAQPMMAERLWLDACLQSPVTRDHLPDQWKHELSLMLDELKRGGAQSVILANPALAPYISLSDAPLAVFNATEIHAWAAASWAMGINAQRKRAAVEARPG